MRHLNYSHLQYFWTVAREGSIAKAAKVLHLTPQTVSGQLKLLDKDCGQPLFNKQGRNLVLSETGRLVFDYAEEIFSIGSELATVVRGNTVSGQSVLNVGMVSTLPKLIAERIVAPALTGDQPIRIRCSEADIENLLADLAVHRLDLVLSDQPIPPGLSITAFNHPLGDSGLSFFLRTGKTAGYQRGFPKSLDGAPMLLPSQNSALRQKIDDWFEQNGIAPKLVGEFSDSALVKAFGEAGAGIYPAPTVIENEICRMYRSRVIGRTDEVTEQFYAISPERRLKHEAVVAITNIAREDLFGNGS